MSVLILLACSLRPLFAANEIPIYSYYTDPPFNAHLPDNLTVRLANWLTEHSAGRYQFKVYNLPRKRLQYLITDESWQGVVAWANPKWFDDANQQRFLWSHPVGEDVNLVASHKENPIEYREPASLTDKTLGGVLGHHYMEFEELILAGKITREDVRDTALNLLRLKARRVDVIFLPASSIADYRRIIHDLDDWLYIAPVPRDSFKRYIFTSKLNVQLMDYINQQIDAIKQDAHWQSIFKQFTEYLPQIDGVEQ